MDSLARAALFRNPRVRRVLGVRLHQTASIRFPLGKNILRQTQRFRFVLRHGQGDDFHHPVEGKYLTVCFGTLGQLLINAVTGEVKSAPKTNCPVSRLHRQVTAAFSTAIRKA